MIDLYGNIRTSSSRWCYDKTLLWNFKSRLVQIENVSYCFTVKQSMSNYVSLCRDIRFLLAFPADKPLILN